MDHFVTKEVASVENVGQTFSIGRGTRVLYNITEMVRSSHVPRPRLVERVLDAFQSPEEVEDFEILSHAVFGDYYSQWRCDMICKRKHIPASVACCRLQNAYRFG